MYKPGPRASAESTDTNRMDGTPWATAPGGTPRRANTRPSGAKREPDTRPQGRSRCEPRTNERRSRPSVLGALTLMLLALALGGGAEEAHAEVLVSNAHLSGAAGSHHFVAQGFVTGDNTAGYTISNIQLKTAGGAVSGRTAAVIIRTDNNGTPEMSESGVVVRLTSPASFTINSVTTFSVPAGTTVELEDETTYWVSLHEGVSNRVNFAHNSRDAETGASGWSIGNGRLWRSSESSAWNSEGSSLILTVNGSAKISIAPPQPGKPRIYGSSMQSGSTTELEVQWQPPGHLDPAPPEVDSYDVRYRVKGAQAWTDGPQDVTVTRATLSGLTGGTMYEVQARATNPVGDSEWSKTGKGRTRTAGQPHRGDVRLVGGNAAGEGRLEIFNRGVWGTVCDDRFKNPGNDAPALACRMLGYDTGEYASGYGQDPSAVPVSRANPIWLDEVLCEPNSTHWTGSPATRLEQCHHAGFDWGMHNCTHAEDAGVKCSYSSSSTLRAELTAQFEDVPESHDGQTPFTVRLSLSAPVENTDADLRDHAVTVTGGTLKSIVQVDGRADLWAVGITPAGTDDVVVRVEATGSCGDPGTLCTAEGEALSETVTATIEGRAPAALTVGFRYGPGSHDGALSRFTVDIVFSERPAGVNNAAIRKAVKITGGRKLNVTRIGGSYTERQIEVKPLGNGPVRLSFLPTLDCADDKALCTAAGGRLEMGASIEIPGPTATTMRSSGERLTAEFSNVPEDHDGSSGFSVDIVFSEPPADMDNEAIRSVVKVGNGTKREMTRVDGDKAHRRLQIEPSGLKPVTVTVPATGDCAASGALCSAGGGKLEEAVETTILGPVTITVGDAEVDEGPDAELKFVVKLSRARGTTVSVDYATEDDSATAGADYTATSGTLTFAAGETTKTIIVPVLNDAHDDDGETMKLTLSNAVGGRITKGEGIGTIHNTDHMPKAWLARFAGVAAEHVFEAAEDRVRKAPSAGMSATIAGVPIGTGRASEDAQEGLDALARWMDESPLEPATRKVTGRDLLFGSTFALTTGTGEPGAGTTSLWGRGAVSRFDGREDELTLDGEVASAMLGADFTHGRWSAGAMLAHSLGEGSYAEGGHGGTVDSTLTGLYPYGRYALTDRVTMWGMAGYGEGTLGLTPDGQPTIETDIDLAMAALGFRGVAVPAPAGGGPEITVTTDVLGVRTTSAEVVGDLAATRATVTRLRFGAESAWHGLKLGGGALLPRLEVGLRQDGGDAETGFGLDVGGALGWSTPQGLSAQVQARGLLTHESTGFSDRGFAGSVTYDPRPGSDRGLSFTLRQSVGASATGGVDALLGQRTLAGLGAHEGDELSHRRLELRIGYGLPAYDERFTATPELGVGLAGETRDVSVGVRLGLARNDPASLDVGVEATRREASDGKAPEHGVALRLNARF